MTGQRSVLKQESVQIESFDEFYRSASPEVYQTLAVVLRDHDLAREATDEAMVRAYERWPKVRGYVNPTGWVYRVALNWAKSRLRKVNRERPVDSIVESRSDVLPDPSLGDELAALPLHHREVIVLRYLVDMTLDQIAGALDVPVGTVKSRLHRALEALRKEFGDDT